MIRQNLVNITIWTVFSCVLAFLASCSDDERIPEASKSGPGTAESNEQTPPPPIAREWYPSPVRAPPHTVFVPVVPAQAQQQMLVQPATGTYYQPVPLQQPQVVVQPAYSYPQQPQQIPQAVVPWGQSVPPQPQGTPQIYQYQVVPGYQTMQRPWGEITYSGNKQKNTTPSQQQPVVVPYGTWPSGGTAPAWNGATPYGAYPGVGIPGYIW
jgi:hypothetical protein